MPYKEQPGAYNYDCCIWDDETAEALRNTNQFYRFQSENLDIMGQYP